MKNSAKTKSILMAGALALAVGLWMVSGIGNEPKTSTARAVRTDDASGAAGNPERLVQVLVRRSTATTITREIVVSARTEPNRQVELRAETDGSIVSIGAERGSRVAAGSPIVGLDIRDRTARLEESEALIEQMRLQYEAAERLRGQQFISEAQIAEARARLVGAEAARKRILDEIGYTNVTAPFAAVVQDRSVEIGDYVNAGDTIARLVDTDPIIVAGEVNEREIHELTVGGAGSAKLVNGSIVTGTIRYLSPIADDNTRTFRVELAVPNPDGALRAGMTAELRVAADEIVTHSLSPALLALADDGTVGVKAVDGDNRVRFHPVEIAGSSPEGILVTGLPNELRIISVGQGFVTEGRQVDAVADPAALSRSEDERPD
jgi:multidrug efflux system membrane fusion protein